MDKFFCVWVSVRRERDEYSGREEYGLTMVGDLMEK